MADIKHELVEAILGSLLVSHPGIVPEFEQMTASLPALQQGRVMQAVLRHPAAVDLNTILTQNPAARSLALLSADAILTTQWPEPVWAVPSLLPVGLTILAGAPKIGKSWLALQLTQAVAAGGVFFGQQVQAGRTLYLALEDSPQRLQKRMQAQGWPAGLPAEFMPLGEFEGQIGNITQGGGEKLAAHIESSGCRLAVIDTLSRAVPGDQMDPETMTRSLTPLQEMAHQTGCSVVLIDHHRKAGAFEPDAVADILGTTAKGAVSDTTWGLYRERGKHGAKLSIVGRDVEEKILALNFDPETRTWKYIGDGVELVLTERREEILDALSVLGKSQVGDIAKEVEQPKSHTHNRLQDLVNAGLVFRMEEDGKVFYERS